MGCSHSPWSRSAFTLALAGLLLAPGSGAEVPQAASGPPPGFTALRLAGGVLTVHDGDTFDADLDGDGALTLPRERVRLLYVDTPELGESDKGQDPEHGLPARDFLARLLEARPIVLHVPAAEPTDRYGRTLALAIAGDTPVSLALIRAGHSYFDTRFQFPADYGAYAAAEAEAFEARRGIWRLAGSRRRYLERLRREGKTPAARSNALYVPAVQRAETFRPAGLVGRYIRVEGAVVAVRTLSKDVRRVLLHRGPGRAPFAVVAFPRTAGRLDVDAWATGSAVRLEGFLQTYRGQAELVLHWGLALR